MSQRNYPLRVRAHRQQSLDFEKRHKYGPIADFEQRRQRSLYDFPDEKEMEHGLCFGTTRVNSMFGRRGEQLCFMEDYLMLLGFDRSPVSKSASGRSST